jgi:hypothetical protein
MVGLARGRRGPFRAKTRGPGWPKKLFEGVADEAPAEAELAEIGHFSGPVRAKTTPSTPSPEGIRALEDLFISPTPRIVFSD